MNFWLKASTIFPFYTFQRLQHVAGHCESITLKQSKFILWPHQIIRLFSLYGILGL